MRKSSIIFVEVGEISAVIRNTVDQFFSSESHRRVKWDELVEKPELLRDSLLIFCIHLRAFGVNHDAELFIEKLSALYYSDASLFEDSVGGIFISSDEEEYTKQYASMYIYKLNKMGLRFSGRPLVEASCGLKNLLTHQKRNSYSLEKNLSLQFEKLIRDMGDMYDRIHDRSLLSRKPRKLLMIHSGNEDSNTLALWRMVERELSGVQIREVHLINGEIMDCRACGYKICKHFGRQNSCYYGGIIVHNIYPAILESDIIVLLCPNYNDALPANLAAMINRLTALFRKQKFYDKKIYAVIVSGSSGTEALATQIIRALNINKTFQLPPFFSVSGIANDKGDIHKVEGIENLARSFAGKIMADFVKS